MLNFNSQQKYMAKTFLHVPVHSMQSTDVHWLCLLEWFFTSNYICQSQFILQVPFVLFVIINDTFVACSACLLTRYIRLLSFVEEQTAHQHSTSNPIFSDAIHPLDVCFQFPGHRAHQPPIFPISLHDSKLALST